MQIDNVEQEESNVGMHLGLQMIPSFSSGTCKVEHLWAIALQNSPATARNPDSVLWSNLIKSEQTCWKRGNWGLYPNLEKTILRRGRSSGAEHNRQTLSLGCADGAWWQWPCQGPPCTPTRLSTPNCHYWLWADYLNRLIWGPKSTSGNDERWSRSIRDIKQQNIFPSTDGNT